MDSNLSGGWCYPPFEQPGPAHFEILRSQLRIKKNASSLDGQLKFTVLNFLRSSPSNALRIPIAHNFTLH